MSGQNSNENSNGNENDIDTTVTTGGRKRGEADMQDEQMSDSENGLEMRVTANINVKFFLFYIY